MVAEAERIDGDRRGSQVFPIHLLVLVFPDFVPTFLAPFSYHAFPFSGYSRLVASRSHPSPDRIYLSFVCKKNSDFGIGVFLG